MASKQLNHQHDAVMALNGWRVQDIQTSGLKLKIPHDFREQMIDGYMTAQGEHIPHRSIERDH
ncbi:hypothetical protein [Neptunomonas qingdaonensis]|uniref:hypothetical protein n=1 Tax=Neptunomonas qingdaonensis TaxID=1045558 RepID=UPI000B8824E2|nr:hypothetical protein [Neptunomonas qingdaonensis]